MAILRIKLRAAHFADSLAEGHTKLSGSEVWSG